MNNMFVNKIENYVFDNNTHKALFKLSSTNIIDSIDMTIASGKEAITFLGHSNSNPIVAKIYKIETSHFNNLNKYIIGDRRFKNIKKDKRSLFLAWASKEYRNLQLLLKNNVSCPVPIAKEKNILVMSFIGEGIVPHPRLNKCNFDYEVVFNQIIEEYAKMLYGANLVHADFSAYNILIDPATQKITIIDVGQAVLINHPKAQDFLKRDIINIVDFLNKKKKKNLTYEEFLIKLKTKKKELYGRNNNSK
jgi:RIO kinase 1